MKHTGLRCKIEFGAGTDQPLLPLAKSNPARDDALSGFLVILGLVTGDRNVLECDKYLAIGEITALGGFFQSICSERDNPIAIGKFVAHLLRRSIRHFLRNQRHCSRKKAEQSNCETHKFPPESFEAHGYPNFVSAPPVIADRAKTIKALADASMRKDDGFLFRGVLGASPHAGWRS
jgi:hypothetical protein